MIFLSLFSKSKSKVESYKNKLAIDEWPEHVVILNENNFDDFIQKYPLSLVDFWASWCAPCKAIAPRLRRLSKVYNGSVAFGKLDTQEYQSLAKKYKIMSIPNLLFFSYGKKLSSLNGLKSVGDIKDTIEGLLKKV